MPPVLARCKTTVIFRRGKSRDVRKQRPGRVLAYPHGNLTPPHADGATDNAVKRSIRKLSLYQAQDRRRAGCLSRLAGSVSIARTFYSSRGAPPARLPYTLNVSGSSVFGCQAAEKLSLSITRRKRRQNRPGYQK